MVSREVFRILMATYSVIIPAYNCAETLAETLDSVMAQRHLATEIIVVNDGSTDATCTLLDDYSSHHKLRIIHQDNLGLGTARNRGAQQATGEWLVFLDSDDVWTPNKIMALENFVQKEPSAQWIYHRIWEWSEGGDLRPRKIIPYSNFSDLWNHNPFTPSAVAIKREVFLEAGGWESKRDRVEDLGLWKSLIDLGVQPYFLNLPLTKYRIGSGITSHVEDHLTKVSKVWQEWLDSGDLTSEDYQRALLQKHYEIGRYFHKQKKYSKALKHYALGDQNFKLKMLVVLAKFGMKILPFG